MSCFVQTEHYAKLMTVMVKERGEAGMNERPEGLKERMDERFDDVDRRFNDVDRRMDEGFARVDTETKLRFKAVDEQLGRVDERFKEVGEHLGRMDTDIRELRGEVKETQRLMIQGFFGICTLMVTCFAILAGMIGF